MKLALSPNSTSQIVHVFIPDATSTSGEGLTGLTYTDITAYYIRQGGALTAMTPEDISSLGTWASSGGNFLGFKEVHSTNAPGVYELDLPNNILASGSGGVVLQLRADDAAPTLLEIQLANVPSDLLAIGGSEDIDGVELVDFFTAQLAKIVGKVEVTDNMNGTSTLSFKKQNGTTESFTLTFNHDTGARDTTGSVS